MSLYSFSRSMRRGGAGTAALAAVLLALSGLSSTMDGEHERALDEAQALESRSVLYHAIAGEDPPVPAHLSPSVTAELRVLGAEVRGVIDEAGSPDPGDLAAEVDRRQALESYAVAPGRFSPALSEVVEEEYGQGLFDRYSPCGACGPLQPDVAEAALILAGPPGAYRAGLLAPPVVPEVPAAPSLKFAGFLLGALTGGLALLGAGAVLPHGADRLSGPSRRRGEALSRSERPLPSLDEQLRARLRSQLAELEHLPASPQRSEALERIEALLAREAPPAPPGPVVLSAGEQRVCEILSDLDLLEADAAARSLTS